MQRASLTMRRHKPKKTKQCKHHPKPEPIDERWVLPCDVRLLQSHTIPKGCSLKTLLTALHAIEQTPSGSE
jgi:hypothetical protein